MQLRVLYGLSSFRDRVRGILGDQRTVYLLGMSG